MSVKNGIIACSLGLFALSCGRTVHQSNNRSKGQNSELNKAGLALNGLNFTSDILPLMNGYCVSCHRESNKQIVVLDSYDKLLLPGSVLEKWKLVSQVIDQGMMPPPPASPMTEEQRAILRQWVKDGARMDANHTASGEFRPGLICKTRGPDISPIRRLTRVEIQQTLRDLLPNNLFHGLEDALKALPSDGNGKGLETLNAPVVPPFLDGMYTVSKAVGDLVATKRNLLNELVPCAVNAATPGALEDCLSPSLLKFAQSAYRRPLTDGEAQTILNSYVSLINESDQVNAYAAIIQSILFSPNFYLLPELLTDDAEGSRTYKVDDYVLASRLSYALWGTMPDSSLLTAAAAGNLTDPKVLLAQFSRMLANPKFASRMDDVNRQWLRLDDIRIPEDPNRPESVAQILIGSLKEDVLGTLRTVQLEQKGTFENLFDTNYAYITSTELAKLYGLDTSASYPKVVQLDAATRGGFLTRAGLLSSGGITPMLSTIRRGRFVRTVILGQAIPEPPPNVVSSPNAKKALGVATDTLREQLTKATSSYSCDFCHRQLNPMGAAFGAYGLDGSWQPTELVDPLGTKKVVTVDDVVDPNIQVMGQARTNGAVGLSKVLGASSEAKLAFAKLWYEALAGHPIDVNNACVTLDMLTALRQGKPTLDLLKIFVTSPEFLLRSY